jgi:hypothetical protein
MLGLSNRPLCIQLYTFHLTGTALGETEQRKVRLRYVTLRYVRFAQDLCAFSPHRRQHLESLSNVRLSYGRFAQDTTANILPTSAALGGNEQRLS